MGGRSTRNKIRYSLEMAAKRIDPVLETLRRCDEVSMGGHPLINQYLPEIVTALVEIQGTIEKLREDV